jgi:hypothetical protein
VILGDGHQRRRFHVNGDATLGAALADTPRRLAIERIGRPCLAAYVRDGTGCQNPLNCGNHCRSGGHSPCWRQVMIRSSLVPNRLCDDDNMAACKSSIKSPRRSASNELAATSGPEFFHETSRKRRAKSRLHDADAFPLVLKSEKGMLTHHAAVFPDDLQSTSFMQALNRIVRETKYTGFGNARLRSDTVRGFNHDTPICIKLKYWNRFHIYLCAPAPPRESSLFLTNPRTPIPTQLSKPLRPCASARENLFPHTPTHRIRARCRPVNYAPA